MRALWLEDRTLSVREDAPEPRPAPGEALIAVRCAGICGTDLALTKGYYPFTGIPGHEFVGEVVGGDAGGWIGRRVVGEINASCGACATCLAGRERHCPHRTVLGIKGRPGAFAEHLVLPTGSLRHVPDNLPDEVAVFTEPLAAALEIQEQVAIGNDDRVVVIGDGRLAQLVAQALALTGCELVVVGRHKRKLGLLGAAGIATTASPASVPPGWADVAVECTGQAAGLEVARALLRPRGTLVLKSTYAGETSLDLSRFVVDEITIVGSRCGPFAPALALLASGRVDVRPLIDARFPLADGIAAFAKAAERGVLKVLLRNDG